MLLIMLVIILMMVTVTMVISNKFINNLINTVGKEYIFYLGDKKILPYFVHYHNNKILDNINESYI